MPRDPKPTRDALLAVAKEQFRRGGYYGTDTNRIAREAGYSPQTFYRHFENKQAAFLAVYAAWSAELLERVAVAESAENIVHVVVEHHRHWGAFRASLNALSFTNEDVREQRLVERRRQLVVLRAMTRASDADLLYVMWCCERIADGIALGEARRMRVSETALKAPLVTAVAAILDRPAR